MVTDLRLCSPQKKKYWRWVKYFHQDTTICSKCRIALTVNRLQKPNLHYKWKNILLQCTWLSFKVSFGMKNVVLKSILHESYGHYCLRVRKNVIFPQNTSQFIVIHNCIVIRFGRPNVEATSCHDGILTPYWCWRNIDYFLVRNVTCVIIVCMTASDSVSHVNVYTNTKCIEKFLLKNDNYLRFTVRFSANGKGVIRHVFHVLIFSRRIHPSSSSSITTS